MFGREKIATSENLAAGKNVKLFKSGSKVIIDVDSINTTSIKCGKHQLEGRWIELEAGEGIIISTRHPNKIKISFDGYALFGEQLDKFEYVKTIECRLEKLEKGV